MIPERRKRSDRSSNEMIELVMSAPGIRSLSKTAWRWLWENRGRQGSRFVVRYVEIAIAHGRSERSARRWIADLRAAGLIRIVNELGRGGAIEIEMLAPALALATPKISLQESQDMFEFAKDGLELGPAAELPAILQFAAPSGRNSMEVLDGKCPTAG